MRKKCPSPDESEVNQRKREEAKVEDWIVGIGTGELKLVNSAEESDDTKDTPNHQHNQ